MSDSVRYPVIVLGAALLGLLLLSWWASALTTPATTTTPVAHATTTTTLPPSTTATTFPPATTTTTPLRGELVIHGTGDVALDPAYIPLLIREGWEHAWTGLDGLFLNDSVSVVNLECVPSDIGEPLDKEFVFRCPTDSLPDARRFGVDVANMGNNHSGDFGKKALLDGREQLRQHGIAAVGAGANYDEAGAPAILEVDGWTVAVVGFGGVAPSSDWYATATTPGMRSGDDEESMVTSVTAAAEMADIVVVTIHWGRELDTQPRPEDRVFAEAMIGAGADVIFGHHQHRLNPLEMVKGVPVFWGLGNFVWPQLSIPSATTAVGRVVISPDGSVQACLLPAFIERHGHPVLQGEPACETEKDLTSGP